ncbi:MAG TPA: hypothetical protein PLL71_09810 [Agriterribacter sp.]|nr:hypothetical protein [Agriterribacter sp.]HRQ51991.1 hypothetical protein [Agriterribacter sp.]
MLTFKSVSPGTVVPAGSTLTFTFEYTDAQGDLANVPVCIEKLSSLSPCFNPGLDPSFLDTTFFRIAGNLPPSANQKGELVIRLTPIQYAGDKRCNDLQESEEAVFKFWLTDLAGNPSDTLVLDPITILKQ